MTRLTPTERRIKESLTTATGTWLPVAHLVAAMLPPGTPAMPSDRATLRSHLYNLRRKLAPGEHLFGTGHGATLSYRIVRTVKTTCQRCGWQFQAGVGGAGPIRALYEHYASSHGIPPAQYQEDRP